MPVVRLEVRKRSFQGSEPVSLPLGHLIGRRADITYIEESTRHFPFTTTILREGCDKPPEDRQSTTREALEYLVALSKPMLGESRAERITIEKVAMVGAESLREYLEMLHRSSTGVDRKRYEAEMRRLYSTGLLD